jgi:NSS family neurotransmitter:Na+ symporter
LNQRETFGTRIGLLTTMIGVAVGLGNVWRFPYMVGKFGGAAFVLFYILMVVLIGIPALIAEWTLGRATQRGPVGAFSRAGAPFGKVLGWFFFFVVTAATAYYTNAIGWVLYYATGEVARTLGFSWQSGAILPPESGFDARSLGLQMCASGVVILACALVLLRGLRAGIEVASKFLMPVLAISLLVLIVRSVTLPGAWAGVEWYLLKFDFDALTPTVMVAAMGQAFFSLSLGGTFMVVYGSYLDDHSDLPSNAVWTAVGDLSAGLLAGLAILPAVFALGLEPGSGPGLIFSTLPQVFAQVPAGWLFGLLFFVSLAGAALLSDIAAFEVIVAGLIDNLNWSRPRAVWTLAATVFLFAIPPMINMEVFVPWDLTFGSGMQTLGALVAVLTVAWALDRATVLQQIGGDSPGRHIRWLYWWLRYVVPLAILFLGIWWFLNDVLQIVATS